MRRLAEFVDSRVDLSDHYALLLLKTWLATADCFDAESKELAKTSLLGFRFGLSEPGEDSMLGWSESHQLLFATCEYLTAMLFGDEAVFTNDGQSGKAHKGRALDRLTVWLHDRFRYGFSEWLSPNYQRIEAAALCLLVDHAKDEALAAQAGLVLDVVLLDLALHSFDGGQAGSRGRSHAPNSVQPRRTDFTSLLVSAFGADTEALDVDDISSIFRTRVRYQVPHALREIANGNHVRRVLTSQGMDVSEVRAELAGDPEWPRTDQRSVARFFWGMEAITTQETIVDSMAIIKAFDLHDHRVLAPLASFSRVPRRLLPMTVRALNPITAGAALQRANVQTFRTHSYSLSSVQHYHPGEFGHEQLLWQAALPGGIRVFGTHPGSTLGTDARPDTPSQWVGNGINPDIAQHDNVLLALYDLRSRKGYLEGQRHSYVHLHFPCVDFDETRFGPNWFAGRRATSYIGVVGTGTFELVSESEVIERGDLLGYAVILSNEEEFTSMNDFVRQIKQHLLSLRGTELTLVTPYGRYDLIYNQEFRLGGQPISSDYPRYDCHWVRAERNPTELTIRSSSRVLHLDWRNRTRTETERH